MLKGMKTALTMGRNMVHDPVDANSVGESAI
jgi:hypothetical protein